MSYPSSSALAPWWREAGATARLAVPLALAHLGEMAILTTDVVMMGWIGTGTLAAGTLARDFFWLVQLAAFGVLFGATPVVAQHLGARRFRHVRPVVRNAFWLGLLLALPIGITAWFSQPILLLLGQEPAIAADGQSYLRWLVWGLVPSLWFWVLAEFLAAHERPRAVLAVTAFAIALNVLLDYALMFGHFGAPAMGLDGAGIASSVVNTVMFLALLAFVLTDRRLRRYRLPGFWWRIEWKAMAEILRVGTPIAVTEAAEMGMFFVTSLMMGWIGVETLAAHGVTAQCYAIVFMIPVGLAQAGAVRTGRAAGAASPDAVARAGWTAIALAGGTTLLAALAFWSTGGLIAGLILDPSLPENAAALQLATGLLAVAAFFIIADAVQIAVRGVLQGLKDTAMPMAIALATSWGLGLPAALLMGFVLEWGGHGIWSAMAVAMAGASLLLVWRFRRRIRRFAAEA